MKVGIDATNAVLFVVLQSAILQLPPFNYMALSIRSSNPSAVSSHIVYKNIYSLWDERRDMDRLTYITPRIKNRNFDTIFPFRKWFCSKLNQTINFINTYWKSQLKSM